MKSYLLLATFLNFLPEILFLVVHSNLSLTSSKWEPDNSCKKSCPKSSIKGLWGRAGWRPGIFLPEIGEIDQTEPALPLATREQTTHSGASNLHFYPKNIPLSQICFWQDISIEIIGLFSEWEIFFCRMVGFVGDTQDHPAGRGSIYIVSDPQLLKVSSPEGNCRRKK